MIHATAIVHPRAKLAAGVSVGAYSIIGEHVEIGEGTTIGTHVLIDGRTRIGRNNRVFSHSALGGEPQDKKYAGEATGLEIGDGNTIREFCTFNCGTVQDAGTTRIGSDNWLMAYVHVAHDCQVGNHTIFANAASIAGHVHVGDHAILGGFTGEQVTEIRRAYKTLYRSGLTLEEAKGAIAAQAAKTPALQLLADFLERSTRGIVR